MRLLCLLFGNWVIVSTFDGSFSSIMFCILAGIADYAFIWYTTKCIRNKRYREVWSAKTKMVSFALNIALTTCCSLILYDQYFSSECEVVTEKFNQCMLMRGEDFDMSKVSVAMSRHMKESMIRISDNMVWSIETITSLKDSDISDEEMIEKTTELKATMEEKQKEMVASQAELQRIELVVAILLFLNFVRVLLWGWTDLIASFKRLRARLEKRRATV